MKPRIVSQRSLSIDQYHTARRSLLTDFTSTATANNHSATENHLLGNLDHVMRKNRDLSNIRFFQIVLVELSSSMQSHPAKRPKRSGSTSPFNRFPKRLRRREAHRPRRGHMPAHGHRSLAINLRSQGSIIPCQLRTILVNLNIPRTTLPALKPSPRRSHFLLSYLTITSPRPKTNQRCGSRNTCHSQSCGD